MAHYSEKKDKLFYHKTNINEIAVKKTGPGTYTQFYKDKNGKLNAQKVVLHDEKLRDNVENIDKKIKSSEIALSSYKNHENRVETFKEDLTKAQNKLKDSEEISLNIKAKKENAEKELNDLKSDLESLEIQLASTQDPMEIERINGEIENKKNEIKNKENEVNNITNEFNKAEQNRKKDFDNLKEAEKKYKNEVNKNFKKPNFTEDDINLAKNQISNIKSYSGSYAIGQNAFYNNKEHRKSQTVKENDLYDLRSIGKEGINFRGIGKAQNTLSSNEYNLSPSRSFYLTDYKFSDSLTLSNDLIDNSMVQPIILNEFQPYDMLSPGDVMDGIGGKIVEKLSTIAGRYTKPLVKLGAYYASKKIVDYFSTNTAEIYGSGNSRERAYFSTDPVQIVQNMFNGGRWLNTYELPYFGGSYLKANYSNDWAIGDSIGFLGASLGNGGQSLGIDFPSNPKFKAKMDKGRDPISLNFYLINSNNDWLKRNFQFLNAIYAGSNWLHLKFCLIRPPNVYHVICPGRFQIYWAAIDVTVTFEGKLRRNEEVSNELRQYSKAITPEMLWPDAWKIDINIKDLTPNNFNLYAEYYQNGFNSTEASSLERDLGVTDIASQAIDYAKQMAEKLIPDDSNKTSN